MTKVGQEVADSDRSGLVGAGFQTASRIVRMGITQPAASVKTNIARKSVLLVGSAGGVGVECIVRKATLQLHPNNRTVRIGKGRYDATAEQNCQKVNGLT